MKKYKLVILIFCVFLVLLCSCGKTTTQELKPSETSIFVQIDNEYDLSSLFEASWAKQVAFSTNDTHLISLNGSKVKGKKEGVAEVFAIYSNSFCSITVNVVKNQEDVPGLAYVTDTYVVYNGKEQFIDINNVPINSTIKYYSNGKEFKGATNVGEYVISVKVFDSNGKELLLSKDTATLYISKATYDLDVRFSKYSFVYDGQEKEVTLLGDLPEGMQVTLVNNKHTEVGEYIVRADFNNPNPDNYYDCDSKIVNMVISRKFVYLKDYNFEDKTVVYNADYQTINLDKNIDGVDSIRFYTFENDEFVKVNQEPQYIDSGEYIYGISIDIDEEKYKNYQYVAYSENIEFKKLADNQYRSNIVSVKFKITKATLINTSKLELVDVDGNATTSINYKDRIKTPWDNLDNYDYEFVITGSLSTGIKNEFANKISIEYFKTNNFVKNEYDNYNYGSYIVGAAYRIDADYEKNYEKVNDLTLSFEIKKIHYDLQNASFVYNKSKVEYDKNVNYENEMGVTGINDVNINIRYFFYKDNGAYIYRDLDNIKNVGSYSIFASFEILNDKDNYYTIPDMYQRYANSDSQLFVIEKKKITLSEITFADLTKTYDGVECSINATGNTNEDISISYTINGVEGNAATNAGTYSVKAYFKYKDYENSNVSFTINDLTGNTLTATLTIQKATYTKEYIDSIKDSYVQTEIPDYSVSLKLSDFVLSTGDETIDNYFSFKNPDNKITLTKYGEQLDPTFNVPTTGCFDTIINYCADQTNYNVYSFTKELSVNRVQLDLKNVAINNQFTKYQQNIIPYVSGIDNSLISISSDKPITSINVYNDITFTIQPINEYGVYLINDDTYVEKEVDEETINAKDYHVDYIYVYDGTQFIYKEGTTQLSSYIGENRNVDVVDGTTEILVNAFKDKDLKVINIPDTVTIIHNGAIGSNVLLEELNLPTAHINNESGNLTSLKNIFVTESRMPSNFTTVTIRNDLICYSNFFKNNSKIKEIKYSQSITEIEDDAFSYCLSLESVLDNIQFNALETIGQYCFESCSSLKTLNIPLSFISTCNLNYLFKSANGIKLETINIFDDESINKEIIGEAFKDYIYLQTINFPKSITLINGRAFENVTCSLDLRETKITTISSYMFYNYKGTSVLLPSGLTVIGTYALYNTENLKSFTVQSSVTSIDKYAFSYSKANVTFEASTNLTTLGDEVFSNYKGESVYLGSIDTLSYRTFYGASISYINLQNVTNIGNECFFGCQNLKSITLSQNPITINKKAFYGCIALNNLVFNSSVDIKEEVFVNCYSLKNIRFLTTTTPTITSTSFKDLEVITLIVPTGFVDAFKQVFDIEHFNIIEE